jgi:hypothetical protein
MNGPRSTWLGPLARVAPCSNPRAKLVPMASASRPAISRIGKRAAARRVASLQLRRVAEVTKIQDLRCQPVVDTVFLVDCAGRRKSALETCERALAGRSGHASPRNYHWGFACWQWLRGLRWWRHGGGMSAHGCHRRLVGLGALWMKPLRCQERRS